MLKWPDENKTWAVAWPKLPQNRGQYSCQAGWHAREPSIQEHRDFFISYISKDRAWAEWIALQLEDAGYSTIIQAWDMRPGSNFVVEMDEATKQAERTLLVLSTAYQASEYTHIEWATALQSDPSGKKKRVLPVRIEQCEVEAS